MGDSLFLYLFLFDVSRPLYVVVSPALETIDHNIQGLINHLINPCCFFN